MRHKSEAQIDFHKPQKVAEACVPGAIRQISRESLHTKRALLVLQGGEVRHRRQHVRIEIRVGASPKREIKTVCTIVRNRNW